MSCTLTPASARPFARTERAVARCWHHHRAWPCYRVEHHCCRLGGPRGSALALVVAAGRRDMPSERAVPQRRCPGRGERVARDRVAISVLLPCERSMSGRALVVGEICGTRLIDQRTIGGQKCKSLRARERCLNIQARDFSLAKTMYASRETPLRAQTAALDAPPTAPARRPATARRPPNHPQRVP